MNAENLRHQIKDIDLYMYSMYVNTNVCIQKISININRILGVFHTDCIKTLEYANQLGKICTNLLIQPPLHVILQFVCYHLTDIPYFALLIIKNCFDLLSYVKINYV